MERWEVISTDCLDYDSCCWFFWFERVDREKEREGKRKEEEMRAGTEKRATHRAKECRHAWICQVRWWK
jgi:hypothetical protein